MAIPPSEIQIDRLIRLREIVRGLPQDSIYMWRWKMEKNEFECFGKGTEPKANLNFNIGTTVANPGVWHALLSQHSEPGGLALTITKGYVVPEFEGALGHDALTAYFGLTPEEEALIFRGESYWSQDRDRPVFRAATVDTVVEHIDRVIDGRKPTFRAGKESRVVGGGQHGAAF